MSVIYCDLVIMKCSVCTIILHWSNLKCIPLVSVDFLSRLLFVRWWGENNCLYKKLSCISGFALVISVTEFFSVLFVVMFWMCMVLEVSGKISTVVIKLFTILDNTCISYGYKYSGICQRTNLQVSVSQLFFMKDSPWLEPEFWAWTCT